MNPLRKVVIQAIVIAFAGALLCFTAIANLNLLRSVYPDPAFYMFGLLALEGGAVAWTGLYQLHPAGKHKGIALVALAVDVILSGTGFFYEEEAMTHQIGSLPLPPVIMVVAFAVLFNVVMGIIFHMTPDGIGMPPAKEGPGFLAQMGTVLARPRGRPAKGGGGTVPPAPTPEMSQESGEE